VLWLPGGQQVGQLAPLTVIGLVLRMERECIGRPMCFFCLRARACLQIADRKEYEKRRIKR
jgi:hypothetical protein